MLLGRSMKIRHMLYRGIVIRGEARIPEGSNEVRCEGESIPKTCKCHPPSLKAGLGRGDHQESRDGGPDRADVRGSPDRSRNLKVLFFGSRKMDDTRPAPAGRAVIEPCFDFGERRAY
jgi:hypothetical protein